MTPDENTVRRLGLHDLVYLRSGNANGEGAYEVRFHDGRTLRVLPDGVATTLARLTALSAGLQAIERHDLDPFVYLVGALAVRGITYEVAE